VFEVAAWRGVCCAEQTQRASPQSRAAIQDFAGVRILHSVMQNSPSGEVTDVQGPDRRKKASRCAIPGGANASRRLVSGHRFSDAERWAEWRTASAAGFCSRSQRL